MLGKLKLKSIVSSMNEETRNEEEPREDDSYLLWDCFVNWSRTLEKLEKGKGNAAVMKED